MDKPRATTRPYEGWTFVDVDGFEAARFADEVDAEGFATWVNAGRPVPALKKPREPIPIRDWEDDPG